MLRLQVALNDCFRKRSALRLALPELLRPAGGAEGENEDAITGGSTESQVKPPLRKKLPAQDKTA